MEAINRGMAGGDLYSDLAEKLLAKINDLP